MPHRPPRFTPPRVSIDADLAWLLRASFAKDRTVVQASGTENALRVARATELSGRVIARLRASGEISSMQALHPGFSDDYYANVARETLLMQAEQRIAQLAERLQVSVIVVKFGGLRLAGIIPRGSRVVADLDVLLPKASARMFWRALLSVGFSRTKTHEYSHQLEALVDPYGAVIDLHTHLPGVVVERGGFATADQLVSRGFISRVSGSRLVPSAGVFAAHAIAHALVQNRSTPQTYSPCRMLADVMDLRCIDRHVVHAAASYLAPELAETCDVLERLCAALAAGAFDGPGFEGTREQALLWHCVAARLDVDYSQRLRAGGLAHKFNDGSSVSEIMRYIADLIYPAEPALDVLYGPAEGTTARIRRRLRRPLDLVTRAARRWPRAQP